MFNVYYKVFSFYTLRIIYRFILHVNFSYIWTDLKKMSYDLKTVETFNEFLVKSNCATKVQMFIAIKGMVDVTRLFY